MKQAMRKGLVSLVTGAAMVASPLAFAAQDTGGMRYTSAAEGFYASIRTVYKSGGGTEDDNSLLDDDTSRFGVQGSNDLGGGLEGFYRYELGTGVNNKDNPSVRLRYVGLRGGFGDIRFGSIWDDTYNFVTSKADMTQDDTGTFAPYFRIDNSIQYNTPDLNGFVGSLRTTLDGGRDEDDLDSWALSAKYNVQGFDVSATYEKITDGLGAVVVTEGNLGADGQVGGGDDSDIEASISDQDRWAIGASYSQDNWYVGGWYGVFEKRGGSATHGGDANDIPAGVDPTGTGATSVAGYINDEDEEIIALGASVEVDKVKVYGVYESKENVGGADGLKDTKSSVGVQYNLGAQSRVWIEYISPDYDSSETEDDIINIGMRHDF